MTEQFLKVMAQEIAAAHLEESFELVARGANNALLGFYISGQDGEPPKQTCQSGPAVLAYPIDIRLVDTRGEIKLIRILGDCGCGEEVAAS
jgi:hypothetical protein